MTQVSAIKRSIIAKNVGWSFIGQLGSFALQAGYFILLARVLTVSDYGIFAGGFGLLNTVMPYSAVGANMLFMRYVAADNEKASLYWGNTLVLIAAMTSLVAAGMMLWGPTITGISDRYLLIALTLSTCLFNQFVMCVSYVFQTYERLRVSAVLRFVSNLSRFMLLVLIFEVWHHVSARQWSFGMLASSLVAASFAWYKVQQVIPLPKVCLRVIRARWWEGFGFAFAGSTQYAYNDVDKTMLTHYGLDIQSGFYSLAYKVIDFATVPIGSIDVAVLPRYFSIAKDGIGHAIRLLRRVLLLNVILGLAIAIGAFVLSPIVPKFVGPDYVSAVPVIKVLCLLPLFRGLHTGIGSMLTGSGFQNQRTVAQVSAACLNFTVNLWAIPHFGWKGAAYTSVATDAFLAIFCILILFRVWLKSRPYISASQPS